MSNYIKDARRPLNAGDLIELEPRGRIVVDRHIGSNKWSLTYLAHLQENGCCLVVKELFPSQAPDGTIRRLADGRIAVCAPAADGSGETETPIPQETSQHFLREAKLLRRAFALHGQGRPGAQTGLAGLPGPLRDGRGNTYLVFSICQGELLRDWIERGFVRDDDGRVVSNQLLGEIIDILMSAAHNLSRLHKDGIRHPVLSPDSIFVVPGAGRSGPEAFFIDYSCACDAPAGDGSEADDVCALASILFYAATGLVHSELPEEARARWVRQLRAEYTGPEEAESLIGFFEKGLAPDPQDRFRSAAALGSALRKLRPRCPQYPNPLSQVDRDELSSYMVLEKYPLYHYKGRDGQNHVLCLGSGVFVRRMILSLLSCGQMTGSHLNIHIVSAEREDKLRSYLRGAAPALEQYSNLGENPTAEYVTFSYDRVADVRTEDACRMVLEKYPDAHYLLISLGSPDANRSAAGLYAQTLARQPGPHCRTVIHYYCPGEDAQVQLSAEPLPKWLETAAFADDLASYSRTIHTLGQRTLKLAHLYNKLDNPAISLAQTARNLSTDRYAQRSSCASALHLKYKLASVGINPAPSTTRRAVIAAYQKQLSGGGFGSLLELEHRRWMMYMIADGYRVPTMNELRQYGFETVDSSFNGAWKCKTLKLHPCLVPCGTGGVALQRADWEAHTTMEAISGSAFDPLDKVSLMLHLLSLEKCRDILEDGAIGRYFRRIARKLSAVDTPDSGLLSKTHKTLEQIQADISIAAENLCYTTDQGRLAQLQSTFSSMGINISGEIDGLRRSLSVFAEYAAHRDYKAPDSTIIQNLLWMLYADQDLTLVKACGRTIADNITAPLILEPRRLVFFGVEYTPEWVQFLRSHGSSAQITFAPPCGGGIREIQSSLEQLCTRRQGPCVIDITGAREELVIAALRIADAHENVSLIRSTAGGQIENIHSFPTAPVYTLNTTIAAGEIFNLYGAREIPSDNLYMEQLENLVPPLWQLYQEFKDDWPMVSAFFSLPGSSASDIWIKGLQITPATVWKPMSCRIDKARWNALELAPVFQKMTDAGIVRDLGTNEILPGLLNVSFSYPGTQDGLNEYVRTSLESFFKHKISGVFSPFRCTITGNPQQGITVDVRSGCRADIHEKKSLMFAPSNKYSYEKIVPVLKRLEELGLIVDLEIASWLGTKPPPLNPFPLQIRFLYRNLALRDCMTKEGNALELYIWNEARKTCFFNNVQANFSFRWKEDVSNELDVILTKGLTSLIVSAKATRYNKEHLYEIKYLTERFSLNSKPVIVYYTDKTNAGKWQVVSVKNRARAMGVYLIDLMELNALGISLGEKLVRIAQGLETP